MGATAPTAVQFVSSVEYCQVPVLLFNPVTAMPLKAPGSGSLTMPAIKAETRLPLLFAWSSLIVVKLLAPASTGAVFTHVTFRVTVAILDQKCPSQA